MAKLIVIAAPSGTGKTSLIKALLSEVKHLKFTLSVSYTTRQKRITEKDGESYYFINKKEFELMIKKQEFLEYADVFGDLYGTSSSWVKNKIKNGWNVILELDWQGTSQVKDIYPDTETIFILPPSFADLKLRLNERGLDKKKTIEKRLAEAKEEIREGQHFDHLVINDEFEKALSDLKTIILANNNLSKERQLIVKESISRLLEL
jgi:guanylate kinase